jgi:hypothetical protein
MPSGLEILAEAQRETAGDLAALVERLGTTQERALETNSRALGELGQAVTGNTQELGKVSRDLGELPGVIAGLAGGLRGGGSVLSSVFRSGLGLAPLGVAIAGLFRGGRDEEPAPLERFQEPARLALEVANTENILAGFPIVSRGQRGEARTVERARPVVVEPQVTVNVSAMDSRSFLDRSAEIAQAVREAMLHMHPVNDLISEL